MGRLPALAMAFFACVLFAACNGDATKVVAAPRERSEVVEAKGTDVTAAVAPTPSAPSPHPSAPRKLCEGQLTQPGRDVPKRGPVSKAAPGTRPPAPSLPTGKWTWVNLWAAWCGPCKEEMPRLRRFAARLGQAQKDLNLAFVSLDDDERQLESFLAAQPEDGVRATYWLREGHERDEWLSGVGLGRDPGLPLQLLVDPRGKIRCTVNGAVEEQDYSEIAAIVSSR